MGSLNNLVLILNNGWTAIRVKNVKAAIRLTARERARIVDTTNYEVYTWNEWIALEVKDGEKYIQGATMQVKIPEVIVLTKYSKVPDHNVRLTKKNLFIRDCYKCQYSGQELSPKEANIDHIIPRAKGGKTTWTNLVVSSKEINRKKGNRTPEEAGLKLLKKPKKPDSQSILFDPRKKIPDSWRKFIK